MDRFSRTLSDTDAILAIAKKTIETEADSIKHLSSLVNAEFADAVNCIMASRGRVIVSGIGKSAIIAAKIAATLNSTGTPSIFMHAGDAIHGDLGTIQENDVVALPFQKRKHARNQDAGALDSARQKQVDRNDRKYGFIPRHPGRFRTEYLCGQEACPNNLAPTTSTTAQLVVGDALAICLLEIKGFSSSDFAKYHPGGFSRQTIVS